MNNNIKEVYDGISVSDDLHDRLMDIPNKKNAVNNTFVKAATVMAAVFVLTFSADMISYAVTGEGVAERVNKAISTKENTVQHIEINGNRIEDYEISDDGTTIIINDELFGEYMIITDETPENILIAGTPVLTVDEHDKRVFLRIGAEDSIEIDITDDISDGEAEGSFMVNGVEYNYTIIKENGVFYVSCE